MQKKWKSKTKKDTKSTISGKRYRVGNNTKKSSSQSDDTIRRKHLAPRRADGEFLFFTPSFCDDLLPEFCLLGYRHRKSLFTRKGKVAGVSLIIFFSFFFRKCGGRMFVFECLFSFFFLFFFSGGLADPAGRFLQWGGRVR